MISQYKKHNIYLLFYMVIILAWLGSVLIKAAHAPGNQIRYEKVNDTMGHEEGDKYIQAAANILKASVGEHGETYRTGGDEFLAIIYGEDPEVEYQSIVKELNNRLEVFNKEIDKPIKLSFAYGHAICTSNQNYSIHDSERLADKEMYECKHAMKAER